MSHVKSGYISPEVAPDEGGFRLDDIHLQSAFSEFRSRHRRRNEDEKWMTEFKDLLKRVAAGAKSFTLKGTEVARLIPGQLNKTLLAKEQPDIVKKYTKRVVTQEFDQAAFAADHPEMFEQYRAQRFELTPGNPAN